MNDIRAMASYDESNESAPRGTDRPRMDATLLRGEKKNRKRAAIRMDLVLAAKAKIAAGELDRADKLDLAIEMLIEDARD